MLFADRRIQELSWRSVAQSRMLSLPVVEPLEGLTAFRLHVVMRRVANAMHSLGLAAVEPVFCRGIVPAVSLAGALNRPCRRP